MTMEDQKDAIKSVLEGILSISVDDNKEAYESISNNPAVTSAIEAIKKGDTDSFQYLFLYGIDNFIDGILDTALDSNDAKFLFRHTNFVESHYENLIEKFEGSACCADKSSAIISALVSHFINDRPIKFNYEGKYTYHLPKVIFKTEEDIVAFFNGLRSLYHGKTDEYLHALKQTTDNAIKEKELLDNKEQPSNLL